MDPGSYYSVQHADPDAQASLIMDQADFAWKVDGESSFQLNGLNIRIPKGKFVGVIGRVGSGKSSFLQAITADLVKKNGRVSVHNWQQGFFAL